jgi:Ca2+-binding EF-hand superfamily protein
MSFENSSYENEVRQDNYSEEVDGILAEYGYNLDEDDIQRIWDIFSRHEEPKQALRDIKKTVHILSAENHNDQELMRAVDVFDE